MAKKIIDQIGRIIKEQLKRNLFLPRDIWKPDKSKLYHT